MARPVRGVIVGYHGTKAPPFERFDPENRGTATDEGHLGSGFYFSTDPKVVRATERCIKAHVRLRRPIRLEFPTWGADKRALVNTAIGTKGLKGLALTEAILERGYDGVILDYTPVGYHHQELVAFEPSQIQIVGAPAGASAGRARPTTKAVVVDVLRNTVHGVASLSEVNGWLRERGHNVLRFEDVVALGIPHRTRVASSGRVRNISIGVSQAEVERYWPYGFG